MLKWICAMMECDCRGSQWWSYPLSLLLLFWDHTIGRWLVLFPESVSCTGLVTDSLLAAVPLTNLLQGLLCGRILFKIIIIIKKLPQFFFFVMAELRCESSLPLSFSHFSSKSLKLISRGAHCNLLGISALCGWSPWWLLCSTCPQCFYQLVF